MEVQKYIKEYGLQKLKENYGIKIKEYDNFIGLNYHQINSPKKDPITIECRSLKLKKDNLEIASRSFDRFFNYGETTQNINLNSSFIFEKVDGSLISIWFNDIDNKWEISSRSCIFGESFNPDEISFRGKVLSLFNNTKQLFENMNEEYTYIFEYIGPDNRIVTFYSKSELVLLGIRHNKSGTYKNINEMKNFTDLKQNIRMPILYKMNSIHDILSAAEKLKNLEEGFVCWDVKNNLRIKIKSPQYVAIHHKKTNNFQDIIKIVISGESDEILTYFPELKDEIEKINICIINLIKELTNKYNEIKNIKSQKDFALKIKNYKYKNLLFLSRKNNTTPKENFNTLDCKRKTELIDEYLKQEK